MDLFEIDALAQFSADRHTKTVFFVVEGEGRMTVDEETRPLRKSSWVFVPKERDTRSLSAETRMTVMATQVR